jgi:hypothetical protein
MCAYKSLKRAKGAEVSHFLMSLRHPITCPNNSFDVFTTSYYLSEPVKLDEKSIDTRQTDGSLPAKKRMTL